jgi:hypothetical protein
LKDVGKVPSERERLIRVVIGARRESRQDLMSLVGMGSSGQVEFEDERMTRLLLLLLLLFFFYDDKDMGTHITLKSTGRGCPRAQFPSRDRPVSQPALFQTLVGHSVIVVRHCRRWGRECMREEGNRRA